MDAEEKLLLQSTASAVVLGSGNQFVLIPLGAGTTPQSALDFAKANGYGYAGVLAVVDGHMEAEGPVRELLLLAAVPFAEYVVAKQAPKDDSAEWCANLFKLEDTREEI